MHMNYELLCFKNTGLKWFCSLQSAGMRVLRRVIALVNQSVAAGCGNSN
jgi:hypothetical protein